MQFDLLPTILLLEIFQKLKTAPSKRSREWEDSLPLLSVCRNWRQELLPEIYASVFINHTSSTTQRRVINHEPQNFVTYGFSSNIKLITNTGHSGLVKSVDIDIGFVKDPLCMPRLVLMQLTEYIAVYPNVKRANITLDAIEWEPEDNLVEYIPSNSELAEFVSAFKRCFPNVCHLYLTGENGYIQPQMVFSGLANCYSTQLQSLVTTYPLDMPDRQFLPNLTCLELNLKPVGNIYGAFICNNSLEYLKLYNIPKHFQWASLFKDMSEESFQFANLKVLDLEYDQYSRDTNMATHNLEAGSMEMGPIYLPKLCFLKLSRFPENCPFATRAVTPENMTKISLISSAASIAKFQNHRLKSIKNMDLCITNGPDEDAHQQWSKINQLLNKATKFGTVELCFANQSVSISPHSLTATTITKLILNCSVDELVGFIAKLPMLTLMVATHLDLDDVPDYVSVPALDTHPEMQLQPFITRVEQLVLIVDAMMCTPSMVMDVVEYLMLRIPTLRSIASPIFEKQRAENFAQTYKQHYPHLPNIRITY